jgi:Protein of unknown function (DUF3150)
MTALNETEKVLEKVWLVDARVSFPGGTISAGGDLVEVESKEAVRVGVQIFDPKLLRPFSKARQRVRRLCSSLGSAFLGGYAIPEQHMGELRREVAAIKNVFDEAKENFLGGYAQSVKDWADAHSDLRSVILSNEPSRDSVEAAFRFGLNVCKVVPPAPDLDSPDNLLHQEVKGLAMQVAKEIAQDVRDSWSGGGGGKTTQRVAGLIRRVRKKADGLAFLHPRVRSLADVIGQVLAGLPSSGPIEGVAFLQVSALLTMLSDPSRILGDQELIVADPEEPGESTSADRDDGEPSNLPERPPAPSALPSLRARWMF